jgi:hypothetical protein
MIGEEVPSPGPHLDQARSARRAPPLPARSDQGGELSWNLTHDRPWFENHVATLELDGRHVEITFEEAITGDSGEPGLRTIFTRRLV